MTLSLLEQRALAALRARLTTRFGDRLASMTLFGSRARGEGHEESDLDVLVLVNGLSPAERRTVFDDALGVELETGLAVSPLPRSREKFAAQSALARDVCRDGMPV
jgi:uncharacterized protein